MGDQRFDGLTESQRACLRLVGQGMSSKEIARTLRLTPLTVDTYLKTALARIGVSNRREAARAWLQWDLSQKSGSPSPALAADPPRTDDSGAGGNEAGWFARMLPPFGGRDNDLILSERVLAACRIAFISSLTLIAGAMILRQAFKVLS